MAQPNSTRTAVDNVIDLATRMGIRPQPLASQPFATRQLREPIEISPREVLTLMQQQNVFAVPAPDAKGVLRALLNVLRNEYSIYGHDFCRQCEPGGYEPDGVWRHMPNCEIGVALRVVEED